MVVHGIVDKDKRGWKSGKTQLLWIYKMPCRKSDVCIIVALCELWCCWWCLWVVTLWVLMLLVMSVNCHSLNELWLDLCELSRFLQIICLKRTLLLSKVHCLEAADFDPSLLSSALHRRSSSIEKVASMLCIKTFLFKQAFSWVPKFILGHSSLRKWNRENVRIILILILEKSRARGPSSTYVIVLADIRDKAGVSISLPL